MITADESSVDEVGSGLTVCGTVLTLVGVECFRYDSFSCLVDFLLIFRAEILALADAVIFSLLFEGVSPLLMAL